MICINKVRVNRCEISIRKTKCFLALALVRLNRNDAGGARGTAFSVGGDGDSSRVPYSSTRAYVWCLFESFRRTVLSEDDS